MNDLRRIQKIIQGFTLLEITIVVIISGVLAGLAYPRFLATVERFRAQEAENVLRTLYAAQQRHKTRNGDYATTLSALDVEIPKLQYFNTPTVSKDTANLAAISRPGQYTLTIDAQGRIACSPAQACGKIGY